jgi:hypothetical protein
LKELVVLSRQANRDAQRLALGPRDPPHEDAARAKTLKEISRRTLGAEV